MAQTKSDVAFELQTVDRKGYLEARISGRNLHEVIIGYIEQVHRQCIQRGFDRVLILESLRGNMTHADIFDVVAEVSRSLTPPLRKIATVYLLRPDQDKLQFCETMARSRGIPARFFFDETEAKSWLLSDVKPC